MIGLIFSKLTQADNIGYIIPGEEIDLFLKDVADGIYDGKPAIHESLQTLENRAPCAAISGWTRKPRGWSSTQPIRPNHQDPLKPFDLITKIGDHEIDNVGMVKIKENLRLNFHLFDPEAREGRQGAADGGSPGKDAVDRFARQDQVSDADRHAQGPVSVVLHLRAAGLFAGNGRVRRLFESPLCSAGGRSAVPLATRRSDLPRFEGEELVVVTSPMFAHKIAKGYDNPFTKVVKEVNGVPIKNLRHFVEVLRDSNQKFTTIRFDDKASETIVFNHQEALKATEEILSDNGIREQASDDLSSVWSKKK